MNVLVVGATGYIGSAVAEELKRAGHWVSGTARSTEAEERLRSANVTPIRADITDPRSLARAAEEADAVIYSVQYTGENGFAVELEALKTLVDALAAKNGTLIYTSGVWLYGSTGSRVADENAPHNPAQIVAQRPDLERIVMEGAARGLRTVVIRPGDVYGRGGGLPAMWMQSAREHGAARIIGDGSNYWPVVHVDDLARLYALALEKAPSGAVYNAADDSAVNVREMAEAASRGAGKGGAVSTVPLEQARATMGAFADALALDSRVTSKRAREDLGWSTRSSTILEDLESGSYT
ncbi:MAG: NAD-dependent epimerase/dehydratase family protein [Vulcanimicrobiaceae bacterium]